MQSHGRSLRCWWIVAWFVVTSGVLVGLMALSIRSSSPKASEERQIREFESQIWQLAGRGDPPEPKYPAPDFFENRNVASLAEAGRDGDCDRINALIAEGVDVNARGKYGLTPLMYAMSGDNIKGFRRLLEAGADPNVETERGTAVHWAARRRTPDFLEIVLAHGGNPNENPRLARPQHRTTDISDRAPIYDAIRSRNPENARLLIKAGADLEIRDWAGWTPLMLAASRHSFEVMLVLLEAGADFRAKDPQGNSVARHLLDNPHDSGPPAVARQKCVDFMEKHGIDFEKERTQGKGGEPGQNDLSTK